MLRPNSNPEVVCSIRPDGIVCKPNTVSPRNFSSADDTSALNNVPVFTVQSRRPAPSLAPSSARKGDLFSKRKSMKFDNPDRLHGKGYTVVLDFLLRNQEDSTVTRLIHAINPVGSTVYVRESASLGATTEFVSEECDFDLSMCSDSLELALPEIKGVVISYKDVSCLVAKDMRTGKMSTAQFKRVLPLGNDTITIGPVLDIEDIVTNPGAALSNVDVVYARLINLTVERCVDIMDYVDNRYRELSIGLRDLYLSLDTTLHSARTEYDKARESGKVARGSALELCHFEIFSLCRTLENYTGAIDTLLQDVKDLKRSTERVLPSD